MSTAETTSPDVPEGRREMFEVDAMDRINRFAREILSAIPEMQGIVIVPTWKEIPRMMTGSLTVPHDGPPTPGELANAVSSVTRSTQALVGRWYDIIHTLDAAAQKLADRLAQHEADYDQLIAGARTHSGEPGAPQRNPAAGAPAGSPG